MKRIIWAPVAVSLALHIGCGGSATNNTPAAAPASTPAASSPAADAPAATTPAAASTESTSQLPSAGQAAVSNVASQGTVQIPEDPKEIIRVFMDAMRAGNGEQLEALFSSNAKIEFQKVGLAISPPGTSDAVFEVQDATQQDDAMIVSSKWIEPGATAEEGSTEIEILWELRKEISGWRVCAMAADPGDGSELQVINFENMEAPGSPETSAAAQAQVAESNAALPAGLPAAQPVESAAQGLPGLPPAQQVNTANAAAPGTIPALPPANQLR